MSKKSILYSFIITFFFASLCLSKGNLFIVGGGFRTDLEKKLVELAGGESARIIIVPNAGGDPLESALAMKKDFEECGAGSVDYIICTRENCDEDSILTKFKGVTCIYISGGDQSRLTDTFNDTEFLGKIRKFYDDGGLIAGNSAGATVMSEIMITGNEIKHPEAKRAFAYVQKGNIETVEGFGFIKKAIIDQHFIARKRHNRLLTLVLENPHLLGIGIDEGTAILVKPDDTFEVFGDYSVMIMDASTAANIRIDGKGNISVNDMKTHILLAGEKFDLNARMSIK